MNQNRPWTVMYTDKDGTAMLVNCNAPNDIPTWTSGQIADHLNLHAATVQFVIKGSHQSAGYVVKRG